jgi:hypothetical protein
MLALMHADKKANANSALKTIRKIHDILQGTASARCCFVAERQQSPSLPRRRLGCRSAKLKLALKHGDEKANANSREFGTKNTTTQKKLTSHKFFTRLISPVLMRAANATQSAAETLQPRASIFSLSTSNSLLPNFTFGMEHAEAAFRLTLCLEKCGVQFHLAIAL